MRALITGGKGFVGNWLAAHLQECGDEVVVVDREVDVTDPGALDGCFERAVPEAVYHLAALTHVGESWDSPSEVLRVNVLGTAEVLAAARRAGGRARVLVVSSAEVYGVVDAAGLPVKEAAPTAPVTPYAASKAACEAVALQAWRGYGQEVLVVRPFNHIGPGQGPTFAVSAFARRIVEARRRGVGELAVGTLSTRRDFTDVRDVVRCYRRVVASGRPGTPYNVCTGRSVALSRIVEDLLALAGTELTLVEDPALVRPVDVPELRGDPTAVWRDTGWSAETPLQTTLGDVLSYWEAQADAS